MSKFNAKMFDRIKESLSKTSSETSSQFDNIMKFPAGHTYTLRLLPILEEGKAPLFHHWVNGWYSKSTGKYVSFLSLKTFGERDPITELRWKLYKEWKALNPKTDNKEYNADIKEKEQWLINVYVIDDPSNPENNGTVKILRMGPQLKGIIDAATEGIRSEELGWEIFNPTAGHDFKICAETQGEFTTFKNSTITVKSKTNLSEDDVEKIYENLHDLNEVYKIYNYEELVNVLNEHYFCETNVSKTVLEDAKPTTSKPVVNNVKPTKPVQTKSPPVEKDLDDDIPMFHDTDELNDLLDGLDV